MPMSDAMRQALAILDGTDKPEPAAPTAPGFYWTTTQGHSFVLAAEHGPVLERAERAEIVLFCPGAKLGFGIALRFTDPAGTTTPWVHSPYSWFEDPGKPHVLPCEDRQMLRPEERIVSIVALDPATGRPGITRLMPLSSECAFALHNRVEVSRGCNNPPGWANRIAEQIDRAARGGVEGQSFARSASPLYPPPAQEAPPGEPAAV